MWLSVLFQLCYNVDIRYITMVYALHDPNSIERYSHISCSFVFYNYQNGLVLLLSFSVAIVCFKLILPPRQSAENPSTLSCTILLLVHLNGQSQKCLLEECSLRVMLPNSRPPQESSEDIVSGKLLERVHKNSFLYSDGAKAWPAVAKRMKKGFKVKQVSHRKQEFVRKSKKQIAGTQVADSRWKRLQKWIPATVKTLRRGKVESRVVEIHPVMAVPANAWPSRIPQDPRTISSRMKKRAPLLRTK